MKLSSVNQSITAVLSGAITTTAPTYMSTFGSRNQNGILTVAPAVTIVPAPAQGELEITDLISIYNADTASATVTIALLDTGVSRTLWVGVLLTGEVVQYLAGQGFKVFDSSGRLKTTAAAALVDGQNLPTGTVTGTQFATAISQKMGFWGATPVTQPTSALQAALTDSSGGVAAATTAIVANALKNTFTIPVQLADLAAGTFKVAVPFAATVLSALFRTAKPASTAAKAATLTVTTNGGGAVTGGVMSLTTANQNTIGGTVAASAISGAGATITAGQTIEVTVSSVTAFVEGDGYVEFTVSNNDLANTVATLAQLQNAIRSALVTEGLIKGS